MKISGKAKISGRDCAQPPGDKSEATCAVGPGSRAWTAVAPVTREATPSFSSLCEGSLWDKQPRFGTALTASRVDERLQVSTCEPLAWLVLS